MPNMTLDSNIVPLFPKREKIPHSPNSSDPSRDGFNGPISGEMWKRVSALNSSYPDNFDWSIYDRLHTNYAEKVRNGGVVFGTTFRLVNHYSSCSKCHYSFELDTYGRGCVHDCGYCYAKDSLTIRGYWNRPIPFPVDLSEIRSIFHTVFETNRRSKWRNVFEQRVPLRIGSMSDSFMWMEKRIGVTRELLKILRYYKYPYVVFTRSDLVAHPDYLSLLDPELCSVQFSISGSNEEMNSKIEPGAPDLTRRYRALKALADHGIWTAVRLNPLFPTYPDGYFTDQASIADRFKDSSPQKFPLFDIEDTASFFDRLSDAKVKTLLAGFVRLSHFAIKNVSNASGIDLRPFFRADIPQGAKDLHYSDSEIAYYYKILQSKALKSGIRFSTCYIGNGLKDYFQYQSLWANRSDCCDIRGNVPGFKTSAQSIPWSERRSHSPDKTAADRAEHAEKAFESS